MAKIEWTDALSVHVAAIDTEHKKLINIINKLHDGMSEGKGNKVAADVLSELLAYTVTHFKHEEELMQRYAYPGLETQKKEHAGFVAKITETQKDYQAGKTMISVPILNFLSSWLKNHIMKTDLEYSSFFAAKGVK
jgi:hemerythrin-like metal-binding protein